MASNRGGLGGKNAPKFAFVLRILSMITANDILRLDYTPDLTEAGIALVCHSLPHTYDRAGPSSYDHLRRTVAAVSVELAFRRYLAKRDIPFDVKAAAPFTDPDHYDITFGSRRCRIQSFLISHRKQISDLSSNLQLALEAPALVPLDHYAADGQSGEDIYVFALITGLTSAAPARRAQCPGRASTAPSDPHHAGHVAPPDALDAAWSPGSEI